MFRPAPEAAYRLPDYLNLQDNEWLVVCTQSCSVCSKNFDKEPLVEVLAAAPIEKFRLSHGDAQGRSSHTFHLPVSGLANAQALLCQLGRRAFIPRRHLLDLVPAKAWVELSALNSFKGWLANYYMRIALPDALVDRLHAKGGIREMIKAALEKEVGGRRVAEGVNSFYIEILPDEELPPGRPYQIALVVTCSDEETLEILDRELGAMRGRVTDPLTFNGVIVRELIVKTIDDTTLQDLRGKSRFNDWDDMSPMPERLALMQSSV